MKGKEAIGAARRREAEAEERASGAAQQLKDERDEHKTEVAALRTEIRRLQADHLAEAGRIASEEVRRRQAEVEDARNRSGMSDDIAIALMWQKDRLIRNACKYLSMTQGVYPTEAICLVLTWATDKGLDRNLSPTALAAALGVPVKGWTVKVWRGEYEWSRRVGGGTGGTPSLKTVSLDEAIESGREDIHPNYQRKWYPPLKYGEIISLDEELPVSS